MKIVTHEAPGSQTGVLRSPQMEPALFEGDLLKLTPVRGEELVTGEIYVVRNTAAAPVVAFRCRERADDHVVFQGDRALAGEHFPLDRGFWHVDKVLRRNASPRAETIGLQLLRHFDWIDELVFPENCTVEWPWTELLSFAARQRVLLPVASALKRSMLWPAVPSEIQAQLERELGLGEEQARRAQRAKARVVELLPGARFLGGAALIERLYPEPGLRPLSTLELFAPGEKLESYVETLAAQGFRVPASWKQYGAIAREVTLMHVETGVEVLVRRALFPRGPALAELDPLDELLYLCASAQRHFGRHALAYWEIYRYAQLVRPPVATAPERARAHGVALAYAFARRVIANWWGYELDAAAGRALGRRQLLALGAAELLYADAFQLEARGARRELFRALLSDDCLIF